MTFAQLAMAGITQHSALAAAMQSAVTVQGKAQAKAANKGKGTIAATIVAGLKAGKAPKVVLAAVLKKHKSNTTIACVYWYASRIKRGLIA